MRQPIFIMGSGLVTPFGLGIAENFGRIETGASAIASYANDDISSSPYYAARIADHIIDEPFAKMASGAAFTKLEKMMILAISQSLSQVEQEIGKRTALIVATTKGNIDVLEDHNDFPSERAYLSTMAEVVANHFGISTTPVVVSNACVSGVLAVAVAKKILESERYDNAIVVAGDLVSRFTLTGFQSFQALSDAPCTPYSLNRTGISLGEGAAATFITKQQPKNNAIEILSDATTNDANHISGPSRTGEGLYQSVQKALAEGELLPSDIDFISAHGTATLYNDEMEAIAFHRAQLQQVPLHSLKGVYGHTLGAAGLIETVLGMEMMVQNKALPTVGFGVLGVSKSLH
ncbi:MAG: beta-ketoacyl synthase N-terminal-like domain-containing protein, partial [Marinirhabdus sp.]|nr:beta-ketoacyl synthase N-terminal-like domain-containing protein [Marinirhabdus sp.]